MVQAYGFSPAYGRMKADRTHLQRILPRQGMMGP